jgi:4'-phosphopantetheinyl transferase
LSAKTFFKFNVHSSSGTRNGNDYHRFTMFKFGEDWSEPLRDDDAVHVFHFPLTMPEPHYERLLTLLSPLEQERTRRFRFARHRHPFIAARAGLRLVLAQFLAAKPHEVVLETSYFGKPFVPSAGVQFSLSHAGGLAAVAVAGSRAVGIDVEAMRPMPDGMELAGRFFAPAEALRLRTIEDSPVFLRAFFECWTRKEAFVKALGTGLSHSLDSFEVTFFPAAEALLSGSGTDAWSLHNVDLEAGYCCALVVEKRASPERILLHDCSW